jgi:hypothetical protein
MTRTPKDDHRSDEPKRRARDMAEADHAAIARLEQASLASSKH